MLNDLRDTFGYKIPEIFGGGAYGPFSPEYQTVYDYFIEKPPDDIAEQHDIMVRGMVSDGDWQTKDIFYITAAQTAADSLPNWINPGTHDLTVVNLAAGQFTAYRGWTGNGVNGYLDTNYSPNPDAINYALDSASLGCYIRTNVSEDATDIGSEEGINLTRVITRWGDGELYAFGINNDSFVRVVNASSEGYYIGTRVAANDYKIYKNKIATSDNDISTYIPNINFYILACNDDGAADEFSTKQVASAFVGGGMTQTNVNNFTDRLTTFLSAIGAAV